MNYILFYRINEIHEYDSLQDRLFRNSHVLMNKLYCVVSHRTRYPYRIKEQKNSKYTYPKKDKKEKLVWRVSTFLPNYKISK